jgi:tRNA G18 (ribose-2'-O)-methylase SpoU
LVTGAVAVESADDPRLADYVALTDASLRRGSVFIVEGELAIRALIDSSYAVRSLLVTPAVFARLESAVDALECPVYVASRDTLRGIVGFDLHRGAVASATRPPLPDASAVVSAATRLAILEGINDHENLGALFRNAAALGVDGVLLDPTCADPLYRRSVRVSLGHVLHVPFARLVPWPAGLSAVREAGFAVVALTPRPEARPLRSLRAGRVAFLLGTEGPGLSPGALDGADLLVRIPMSDGVDSLNVATAAAVAFHWVGSA